MESKIEYIIFYSFGVVVVINLYLHYLVQKILQKKHPEVWFSLGQPDQFSPTNDVMSKQSIMKNYLKDKQYLSTKDLKFIKLCNFLRIFNKVSFVLLILFFASMTYFIFYNRT